MRKRLVVANWKMNLSLAEAERLVNDLDKKVSASSKTEVVICPPALYLMPLKTKLKPLKFALGAQNLHWQDHGAVTGETSAAQLAGTAAYALIGHSERRLQFGETNDVVARKVSAAVRNQLTPIICVGETLTERQDNHTDRVLHDQLAASLIMLTGREVANVVVAYEPVWAVGSDTIAKPEQIKAALRVLRKTVTELYGATTSEQMRLLYGGSVEPDFIADYLKIKDLDGFLVGHASLNAYSFADIVKAAQRSKIKRALRKA